MSEENYKPQSILITGGAGFIASHVAIRLIKNYPDYKVRNSTMRQTHALGRYHIANVKIFAIAIAGRRPRQAGLLLFTEEPFIGEGQK